MSEQLADNANRLNVYKLKYLLLPFLVTIYFIFFKQIFTD